MGSNRLWHFACRRLNHQPFGVNEMKMNLDLSVKGFLKSLVYVACAAYTWVNSIGIDAYLIVALAVAMGLDMLLGWIKAAKVDSLTNPTSRRAIHGILSKSVIFAIPVVVGLVWGAIDSSETAMKVVNVQLMGILIAEAYSVIGNVYAIYTGESLSEFDAFTYLIKATGKGIRKLLEKMISNESER